jgi:hypothetical protein
MKTLVSFLFLILLSSVAFADTYNLKESSTSETGALELGSNVAGTSKGVGQTFTPASDYSIGRVILKLQRIGSPSGNVKLSLYATSGGLPTGGAVVATNNVDVSTISSSLAEHTFDFTSTTTVSNGVMYAIALETQDGYSGDGDNHINVRAAEPSVYAGGTALAKNGSSVWSTYDWDLYFKNYEQVTASTRRIISIN